MDSYTSADIAAGLVEGGRLIARKRPIMVRELQVGDVIKLAEAGEVPSTVIEIERLEFSRTIVTVRYEKPPPVPFLPVRTEMIRVWLWESTHLDQWENDDEGTRAVDC